MQPDLQPDEPDYIQHRDNLLDVIKLLGVGITIDPFSAPEQARDQLPQLLGVTSGALDLASLSHLRISDDFAVSQWITGYHFAASGEGNPNARSAFRCFGVAAMRMYLTWALYSALRTQHPYAQVVARLLQAAAQLSSIASTDLDDTEETSQEYAIAEHEAARQLLTETLTQLDNTIDELRDKYNRTQL